MASEWRNWAGDQRCDPAAIERPRNRGELIDAVAGAAAAGKRVRIAGSGHSFSDIACTNGVMVRADGLDRVLDLDRRSGLVKAEAGIVLGALGEAFETYGLAMENQGDIDRQTLGGSLATATHGTGVRFRNLSSQVEAMELITADGSAVELSADRDPEGLLAARVSLGALGAVYSVTLRSVPAYTIRRIDHPMPLAETLAELDALAEGNDHFEFYVFPHTDIAVVRESRRTEEVPPVRSHARDYLQEVVLENWTVGAYARITRRFPRAIPPLATLLARGVGRSVKVARSHKVFASQRRVKFTEMEYAIPRKQGAEAVRRVMDAAEREGMEVSFPIEVRFVAADDAFLSPAHERDSCYVAVHQYRGMEFESYFRAVEAIMDSHDGRPHWGKRHYQSAATLAPRYPEWQEFAAVRARLDPQGRFGSPGVERVLGSVRCGVVAA